MGEGEGEEDEKKEHIPSWFRGLALEILRGWVCCVAKLTDAASVAT